MNEKELEFNERFEAGPIDILGGRATLILQNKKTDANEDTDFQGFTKINFIRRG